jgi:putative flavoprotein involved in K+ transport
VILEASDRPAGSWPRYYDSLLSFSPAAYSSMPGMAFPGDPDHYPTRDEVADYLETYAAQLDVEVWTNTSVATIQKRAGVPRRHRGWAGTRGVGHRGRERVVLEPVPPELRG